MSNSREGRKPARKRFQADPDRFGAQTIPKMPVVAPQNQEIQLFAPTYGKDRGNEHLISIKKFNPTQPPLRHVAPVHERHRAAIILADCKRKAGRGGHNARPSVATRGIPFDEAGFSRTSLEGKGINCTHPRDNRASAARPTILVAQSTQDEQRDRQRRDAYSASASSTPCVRRCC